MRDSSFLSRNTRKRIALAVSLFAGMAGSASAVTDADFTYSAAKPGFYMVDPAALVPTAPVHANTIFVSVIGGFLETEGNQSAC